MKFNINDYVWVRLTKRGKDYLWSEDKMLAENVAHQLGGGYPYPYMPVREARGEYTKFQMWELMSIFGRTMYNGADPCFDLVVLINEDP